jgi:hypothetical protein
MATNEFRWGVKLVIPGQWCATLKHDGFDVEIAADWIEVRKEQDGERDAQQRHAETIVEGIIRKIGLAEKLRFTAILGSVSRFDPQSDRRDTNVFLSDSLVLKASLHADVVVASANGRIVADSRKERMTELLKFVDACAADETLRRMSDYMLEYHDDPGKKLAPLFDIIELAAEVFGHEHRAATSLGVDLQRMKDATNVMNDASIRSGRHRGQELGCQRDPLRLKSTCAKQWQSK